MKKTQQRKAGVLLHISSLPEGTLGLQARRFVDFLYATGASVWQTLPLNMPHNDGSPYQCLSAHAGNPAFIDLQQLLESGYLNAADLQAYTAEPTLAQHQKLFEKAFCVASRHADSADYLAYKKFCRKHRHWLNDFALFLVLREQFDQASWNSWPVAYKKRDVKTLNLAKKQHAQAIAVIKFTQYIFFQQWCALKEYANQRHIAMFGDIPIFVAFDSADVWANSTLFKLNKRCNMTVVAGVPPDYFSSTGQRWGNPHYNWRAMKQEGFKWWLARMRTQNSLFDMVRIDHFRGLEAAWEIPASEDTAINGKWRVAPGSLLLAAIKKRFKKMCLVAEDLGIITDEVNALRHQYQMPGMKILQFAFGGGDDNLYLPQNIEANSVVYTGTHDNDTSLGWYQQLEENAKNHLHSALNTDEPDMPNALIDMALATQADLAIIPMQDILALDSTNRMNTPGTLGGNWVWRFDWAEMKPEQQQYFADAVQRFGRHSTQHS
ncbi:MAG: 4-alpha-glucanotransferase [Pseudomonadota bacterium]